jgi:hypothetical protein
MKDIILFALFLVIAFVLGIMVMYFFGAVKSSVPIGMLEDCSKTVSTYRENLFDCREKLYAEVVMKEACEDFVVVIKEDCKNLLNEASKNMKGYAK